jgi:hypothetical protein
VRELHRQDQHPDGQRAHPDHGRPFRTCSVPDAWQTTRIDAIAPASTANSSRAVICGWL